jgi:hypothetical protein
LNEIGLAGTELLEPWARAGGCGALSAFLRRAENSAIRIDHAERGKLRQAFNERRQRVSAGIIGRCRAYQIEQRGRGFENVFGAACSLLRHQPHCLVTLLCIALDIAGPADAADDENGR